MAAIVWPRRGFWQEEPCAGPLPAGPSPSGRRGPAGEERRDTRPDSFAPFLGRDAVHHGVARRAVPAHLLAPDDPVLPGAEPLYGLLGPEVQVVRPPPDNRAA